MQGSTAVGGYVVALGMLSGAFALVVADPDDGRAWIVAGIGALGVLLLPCVVLLILNVLPARPDAGGRGLGKARTQG
jgi:hypothetical protein